MIKLFNFLLLPILLLVYQPSNQITKPLKPLPLPPTNTVGQTEGQFQVNEAGKATYSIPIQVSPGTAGLQPNISVNLVGTDVNGLLGIGGVIGGLSTITRCPTSLEREGFCLDGEPLVVTEGTYGISNSEYQTEQESFRKIKSYGSFGNVPEYFKVWTKEGLIMEYGVTSDSRIKVQGDKEVVMWALNKISDRNRNYIDFVYNSSNNEFYPKRIDYTGNSNTGSEPYASIEFNYGSRTDKITKYVANTPMKTHQRLNSITSKHGNRVFRKYYLEYQYTPLSKQSQLMSIQECGSNGKCLKPTTFEWTNKDELSFNRETLDLTGIWGEGAVPYILDFNYDGLNDLMIYKSNGENYWIPNTGINGDPKFNLNDAIVNPIPLDCKCIKNAHLFFADFTGNGLKDMMYWHKGSGRTHIFVNNFLKTGTLDFTLIRDAVNKDAVDQEGSEEVRVYVRDYNGDGIAEPMWYFQDRGELRLYLNNGIDLTNETYNYEYQDNKGGEIPLGINRSHIDDEGWDDNIEIHVEDFNSDGLPDILYHVRDGSGSDPADGTNRWYINTGIVNNDNLNRISFLGLDANVIPRNEMSKNRMKFGDVNKDGLTDVFRWNYTDGTNTWWVNQGIDDNQLHFTPEKNKIPTLDVLGYGALGGGGGLSGGSASVIASTEVYFPDFNGDGLLDAFCYFGGGIGPDMHDSYHINKGDFDFNSKRDTPEEDIIDDSEISSSVRIFVADMDGDSFSDVIGISDKGEISIFHKKTTSTKTNLIKKITTGQGVVTEINYEPLTNNAIYQKENAPTYPEIDFIAPVYVVSSYSVSNGIGGKNKMNYEYKFSKFDVKSRGFRGFSSIKMTNETTGNYEVTEFNRNFKHLNASVKQKTTYSKNGKKIHQIINQNPERINSTYEEKGVNHFAILSSTETSRDEKGNLLEEKVIEKEYDQYGNLKYLKEEVQLESGEKDVSETFNTYRNITNGGQWIIGLLTKSELKRGNSSKIIEYIYDENRGLKTGQTVFPDHPLLKLEKKFSYDGYGNRIESEETGHNGTEEISLVNTFEYYKGRLMIEKTNALGHITKYEYDEALGSKIKQIDPNGLETTWDYDAFGRTVFEKRPDFTTTSTEYESCENNPNCPARAVYSKKTTVSGKATVTEYFDKLDRVVLKEEDSFESGQKNLVETQYNQLGQVWKKSIPYFKEETPLFHKYEYDLLGRTILHTHPNQGKTEWIYEGNQITVEKPKNQEQIEKRNRLGNLVSLEDDTGISRFYYDSFDNLIEVIDSEGTNSTKMLYDIANHRISLEEPNTHTTTFVYNAFDELVSKTDAKEQTISYEYDLLGRRIKEVRPEETIEWIYDTILKGKLTEIVSSTGLKEMYQYDEFSRLKSKTINNENQPNESYTIAYEYNGEGQISQLTYPKTNFAVKYAYRNGFVSEVKNANNDQLYWKLIAQNANGQQTVYEYGNGIQTTQTYEKTTGLLNSIHARKFGTPVLQEMEFTWDILGNLTERKDLIQENSETLEYDSNNRLTKSTVANGTGNTPNGSLTDYVDYDKKGNITYRSAIGHYIYESTTPNGVAAIHNDVSAEPKISYAYDANGNRIWSEFCNGNRTDIEYNSLNKPTSISKVKQHLFFDYGVNSQVYKQKTYFDNQLIDTKVQIDDLYEEITDSSGFVSHRHYLKVKGRIIAIYEENSLAEKEIYYLHKDHLGSIAIITNKKAEVEESFSFDAWGKRRSAKDWTKPYIDIGNVKITEKGFSNHEHLTDVGILGLINTGGRLYDPYVARFLSADPFVQSPENSQNFNRYSYVLNNPLSYIDPSGYIFSHIWDIIEEGWEVVEKNWKPLVVSVVAVGLILATGPLGGTLGGAILSGAITGFGTSFTASILADGHFGNALLNGLIGGIVGGAMGAAAFKAGLTTGENKFSHKNFLKKITKSIPKKFLSAFAKNVIDGKNVKQSFEAGFLGILTEITNESTYLNHSLEIVDGLFPDWKSSKGEYGFFKRFGSQTLNSLTKAGVKGVMSERKKHRDFLKSFEKKLQSEGLSFGKNLLFEVIPDDWEKSLGLGSLNK